MNENITLAQIDVTVGDIRGNVTAILAAYRDAEAHNSSLVITSELAICGYPPEDLLYREDFLQAIEDGIRELARATRNGKGGKSPTLIVGAPVKLCESTFLENAKLHGNELGAMCAKNGGKNGRQPLVNAAVVLEDGEIRAVYGKEALPNYSVFDEERYFVAVQEPVIYTTQFGTKLGLLVCEDLWRDESVEKYKQADDLALLVVLNASPYHHGKQIEREGRTSHVAKLLDTIVVYVNQVGSQDELVFDGGSHIAKPGGSIYFEGSLFEEATATINIEEVFLNDSSTRTCMSGEEELYRALMAGLAGYVRQNGFEHCWLGVSGGIDSALVATVAVDALGAKNVTGIAMPGPYSSGESLKQARELCANLECGFETIAIRDVYFEITSLLGETFNTEDGFNVNMSDVSHQNLQARLRGMTLMAASNRYGGIVLATGNKSEMAVGYATLYGDMAGGYAVLKDVYKTDVYALAKWRNDNLPYATCAPRPIPQDSITRPPTAELAPDQLDTDSLPEYDVLDAILKQYIEHDASPQQIADATGYNGDLIVTTCAQVDRNEYKRRQAPGGTRVSIKGLGRDRRLPITSKFYPQVSTNE